MEIISEAKAFDGIQGVYSHQAAATNCKMTFAVYMPPQAQQGPVPVLWYLSGLTCSHANVMDKGEYRQAAADMGVCVVCPDTSPRGADVPDDADNWQFGHGAGFYLDATVAPYNQNYQMQRYLLDDLPTLIGENFAVDLSRQGIFGHSMGGHGALTLGLKNPDRFSSCSAFAPIVSPSTADWSRGAFERYLGPNLADWRALDACNLVEDGHRIDAILIDQGDADGFLDDGLRPWLFETACAETDIDLTLRMQPGYDHSYCFISSFMADHIHWHADKLT